MRIWTPKKRKLPPCNPRKKHLQTLSDVRAYRNRFQRNPWAKVGSLLVPQPLRLQSLGLACCCECHAIAYEKLEYDDVSNCDCICENVATNLRSNWSAIDSYKAVFMGHQSPICGDVTVHFPEAAWPDIKSYVENGGRLWVASEFTPCLAPGARTVLLDFLDSLGSSMEIGEVLIDEDCVTSSEDNINTAVPMMADITSFYHNAVNVVTGGTWLAKTNVDGNVIFAAMENIGDGYILLVADSTVIAGHCGSNCSIYCAFVNNSNDNML